MNHFADPEEVQEKENDSKHPGPDSKVAETEACPDSPIGKATEKGPGSFTCDTEQCARKRATLTTVFSRVRVKIENEAYWKLENNSLPKL